MECTFLMNYSRLTIISRSTTYFGSIFQLCCLGGGEVSVHQLTRERMHLRSLRADSHSMANLARSLSSPIESVHQTLAAARVLCIFRQLRRYHHRCEKKLKAFSAHKFSFSAEFVVQPWNSTEKQPIMQVVSRKIPDRREDTCSAAAMISTGLGE